MPGLLPRLYKDHRRYSFPRTFGTVGVTDFINCDFDATLSDFNQNLPNPITGDPALPNGCTCFTRCDIASNEDHILYKPGFTYGKSCLIENVPFGSALPLETSFKSGIIYGLQAVGETTDAEALTHRRGAYFEVHPVNGQDWFDALWSALIVGQKCLSVGTPWFPELTNASSVTSVNLRSTNDWHNWEVLGVHVSTQPYLKVKAWTGDIKYFSRSAVNSLMSVKGSDCLTDINGKASPQDIQLVRLNIWELLISLYQRLLSNNNQPSMTKLDIFCTALRDYEGVPGDLNYKNNNPGNCRCSPMGYLPKYGNVRCANNFAVFPTYELGWEYLENLVHYRVEEHPDWTFLDFFNVYAPSGDNNNPNAYAENVAGKCEVPVETKLTAYLAS